VYPKLKIDQKKQGHCFYGAVNITTGEHLVHDTPHMTSEETVKFLDKLKAKYQPRPGYHTCKRPVLLLWDGAPWHRGRVKDFLKDNHTWLHIEYFPPYSPALNPQEYIWKQAKAAVVVNHEETDFEVVEDKFYHYLTHTTFSATMCQKILRI
jgi:hypothetical protein